MRAKTLLMAVLPIASLLLAAPAMGDPRDPRHATTVHYLRPHPPTPDGPAAGAHLTYYGGRVISNVKVYAVNWGSGVSTEISSQIGAFYTTITASPYFDWLGEYNTVGLEGQDGQSGSNQRIGRGSFGGSFTVSGVATTGTVTDAQIQSALEANLASGVLPQPDLDAAGNVNAVYMFDFPPGLVITGPGGQDTSCIQFCAYHGTASVNGRSVPYGVLPDLGGACAQGCGTNATPFNNATSVHSHELAESVTDTEVGIAGETVGRPLGWYDSAANTGEVADICNAMETQLVGYTVQLLWSNVVGDCIASRDLPMCTGTNAPCTPCAATDDGVACSGATPVCATAVTDAKLGQCVACTTNAQCSGATPTCDQSGGALTDSCRACAANADCSGASAVCEIAGPKTGQCVQCNTDTDCTNGEKCDTSSNTCIECQSAAQCANPTPACSPQRQCAPCTSNSDCEGSAAGSWCDVATGACGTSGGTASSADGGVGANANTNPALYYSAPNTNMTCALADGDSIVTVGAGALALLAAAGAARRRKATPAIKR